MELGVSYPSGSPGGAEFKGSSNLLDFIGEIRKQWDMKITLGWFVWFYGISTFVDYLMPNTFLCKSILFKTVQFSISTGFNCQKHIYFKLFKQLYVAIQLSVNTVSMSKTSSISNNSVKHKHAV